MRFLARLETEPLPRRRDPPRLHGAMVAEDAEDLKSDLRSSACASPRARLRSRSCSTSIREPWRGARVEESDILLAYDTPAIRTTDMAEARRRGRPAAPGCSRKAIEGHSRRPSPARRVPLADLRPLAPGTAAQPDRLIDLLVRARRLPARGPGRPDGSSLAPGFAYADVDRVGFAVLVDRLTGPTAGGQGAPPTQPAERGAGAVETAFRPDSSKVSEAVEPAPSARTGKRCSRRWPTTSAAVRWRRHSTSRAARRGRRADGAVAVLCDPEARRGATPGPGLGGGAPSHDAPRVGRATPVAARRASRPAGRGRATGGRAPLMAGSLVDAQGSSDAVVEVGRRRGGADLAPVMPFDDQHLAAVGIDAAERRIVVVKSAVAWRAGFAGAEQALALDTPGVRAAAWRPSRTGGPSPLYSTRRRLTRLPRRP